MGRPAKREEGDRIEIGSEGLDHPPGPAVERVGPAVHRLRTAREHAPHPVAAGAQQAYRLDPLRRPVPSFHVEGADDGEAHGP